MKILWLCPIVVADFSEEFGIKKNFAAGWISGLYKSLKKYSGLEMGFCLPIIDVNRMRDGVLNGAKYYSFNVKDFSKFNGEMTERFEAILKDFKPDIVHIWGSESPHSLSMLEACENLSMLDITAVDIQAFYSVYPNHFNADVPLKYIAMKGGEYKTIVERNEIEERGKLELRFFDKVRYMFGRTDWDRACISKIKPSIGYYHCNRILRNAFYEYAGKWNVKSCNRCSIFTSQAHYPIKGIHYLLRAMPDILSKYPDAHLNVAGVKPISLTDDGINPYGVYINDLISEFGLEEKVTFLGPLGEEEMVKQYLNSNVLVSPSTVENSSNTISEAAILGVPVVSSYAGGNASLLKDKDAVLFYQHDAPYMLAYYVCQIFGNDELAIKLSENASESMRKTVDREVNAKQYIDAYNDIARKRRKNDTV